MLLVIEATFTAIETGCRFGLSDNLVIATKVFEALITLAINGLTAVYSRGIAEAKQESKAFWMVKVFLLGTGLEISYNDDENGKARISGMMGALSFFRVGVKMRADK